MLENKNYSEMVNKTLYCKTNNWNNFLSLSNKMHNGKPHYSKLIHTQFHSLFGYIRSEGDYTENIVCVLCTLDWYFHDRIE